MKLVAALCACLAALAVAPNEGLCAGPVQRYLLVAGANQGGLDRPKLQYAVSDAERFAKVLVDLGGVAPADQIVLKEPRLRDFLQALDHLSSRVSEGRRTAAAGATSRTEVLVYYSGHADEKGLLFGEDRYSYRSLRDRLDQIPADVRIAVLDACASGAFTRIKGGRKRPAFLVDESASMRGHAFLTSSAESEAAQESDRIGASYFTHYLVSGLHGAADTSGDRKVTLNEAYQFAFNETLGRTEQTKGGPQHPSYDITLSGSGDVVMTDVRQTSATLVLGETLAGRFFIRDAAKHLVVELYKPAGRTIELGLEPDNYEIRVERDSTSLVARARIAEGEKFALDPAFFRITAPEVTRRRGVVDAPSFAVAGRNRLELRIGIASGAAASSPSGVVSGTDSGQLLTGLQYTRFLSEAFAFTFSVNGFAGQTGSRVTPDAVFSGTSSVLALPLGVRWNPGKGERWKRAVKPYVALSVGPVIGSSTGSTVGATSGVFSGTQTLTTIEGQIGAGADVHIGRRWSIGLNAGYNRMRSFSAPIGGRRNYSGFELGFGFGLLFGRGYGLVR